MALTMTVDHDRRRVFTRADGDVTLADALAHLTQERVAAGLPYSELVDGRGFRPAFSTEDVRTIVSTIRRLATESTLGPTAVVVDTDLGYGMLRMIEILVEGIAVVRPFRRMDEATEWLDEIERGNA